MRAFEILPKRALAQRLRGLMLRSRDQDGPRVPLSKVTDFAGISKATLYLAARGEMSETTQIRLSRVLQRIEWGLLRFEQVGREWRPVHSQTPKQPPLRMAFAFTPTGPKLIFVAQSPPVVMPSVGSLFSRRKA